MAKALLLAALLVPATMFGQLGIGLKGGLNFANVTNASSINSSSRSGFMIGAFIAPQSKGIISSRTEIVYSRQGYNFQTTTKSGNVDLDYIILPQLMGINITKFVQIQLGFQVALLLNAKTDTGSASAGLPGPYASAMSYYNKYDYGFGAGIELHPVLGLMVGARYNISLGKLYKDLGTGQSPSFTSADAKNNVVQIFAGWIFGSSSKKNSKK